MKRQFIFPLLLSVGGCASIVEDLQQYVPEDNGQVIEAQRLLGKKQMDEVYQLDIITGHKLGQFVYLNTQPDSQDPQNITVTLAPGIAQELAQRYAKSPEAFFVNKTIRVSGEVRQVKMWEYQDGQRTNKYFYQTRIKVRDAGHISF